MKSKLLTILAALIMGSVAVVGYKHYAKTTKNTAKETKAEQNNNHKEQSNVNENTQKNEFEELFNISNAKNPEDFKKTLKQTGPYTCYIKEYDKVNHITHKSVISTNGKDTVYVENISSDGESSRIWVIDNIYYIETKEKNGEVTRLKIEGAMADAYAELINSMFNVNAWKQAAKVRDNSDKYDVDITCKKGKVDIPNFDKSLFKSFDDMYKQALPKENSGSNSMPKELKDMPANFNINGF